MATGGEHRAKSTDFGAVEYPEVRRGLLSQWDDGCDEIEWLVEAGSYLRACWLSEAEFLNGAPLDEAATKHLWDEFTVGDLATQRSRALGALSVYVKRKRFEGIVKELKDRMPGAGLAAALATVSSAVALFGALLRFVWWCMTSMFRGVLGLIGVWIAVSLILGFFPDMRDKVRGEAVRILERTK